MNDKQTVVRSETETQTLLPRVDVFEDDNGIQLFADLPGVPKEKRARGRRIEVRSG